MTNGIPIGTKKGIVYQVTESNADKHAKVIVYVNDEYAGLADKDDSAILLASENSYKDNTFKDGTPFGMKVEE